MSEELSRVERDRRMLVAAKEKGTAATTVAFLRLSGPGWLQSALTLGGGSLGASLYLGVLTGYSLLWLQPMAMILGIVMLSAIGYVTMSTNERPFQAINKHVNPVLGWSWALASLMANMVWAMPQFSLANGVVQQNLLPQYLGADSPVGEFWGKVIIAATILTITVLITWSYGSGHWGIKLYETLLKLMVAMIVLCFAMVVYYLLRAGKLEWGSIAHGFIPDISRIFRPAPGFTPFLEQVPAEYRDFWRNVITNDQTNKMAAAAATAVGINMTFLFPYSILRKGWTKEFRGLQIFDLSTGMFIPFVLATSCVIIASASQFHAKVVPGLVEATTDEDGNAVNPTGKELTAYRSNLTKRLEAQLANETFARLAAGEDVFPEVVKTAGGKSPADMTEGEKAVLKSLLGKEALKQMASGESVFPRMTEKMAPELLAAMTEGEKKALKAQLGAAVINARIQELPRAEREIAAMLVSRDANRLSSSLAPLAGGKLANILFGAGVVAMTMSSITLLMLISGFVMTECFNIPKTGWPFRLCCCLAGVGVLGPFVWSKASFALVIPTSVFGLMVLPIAYLTFFLLMNQKSLLGEELPRGGKRILWNLVMALAAGTASVASLYMVWMKVKEKGLIAIGILLGLALVVQVVRWVRGSNRTADQPAKKN